MNNNANGYNKKLFQLLQNSANLKEGRTCFSKCIGSPVFFIASSSVAKSEFKKCQAICEKDPRPALCEQRLREAMHRSIQTKKIEKFTSPSGLRGFCYPVAQGDAIYGFILACNLKEDVPDRLLALFASFADSIVRETQKEMELKKLYETLRPRAIALSTVHTVHRLISSTLDMDELLPRIARLSLQILRANRCSIKLLDSKKKTLLPMATIDLRKKARLKKVKIGMYAPGKAVKYGKAVRGSRFLAIPLVDEDVIGVITVYDKIDNKPFSNFDEEIMKTLAEQATIAIKNAQLYEEQEKLTTGGIKSLAALLEMRSSGIYTAKASFMKIVHLIGQEFKMSVPELKSLQYATILHDAGQIILPDKVLKKKGMLTGKEYRIVKEHPIKGASILKPLKALKSVVPAILYHHENYNGTGYPKGLKGEDIPLSARILAVVAAFEAMITRKPYRRTPMTVHQAVAEIKKFSGTQFDPRVVASFYKVIGRKDIRRILRKERHGVRS